MKGAARKSLKVLCWAAGVVLLLTVCAVVYLFVSNTPGILLVLPDVVQKGAL